MCGAHSPEQHNVKRRLVCEIVSQAAETFGGTLENAGILQG